MAGAQHDGADCGTAVRPRDIATTWLAPQLPHHQHTYKLLAVHLPSLQPAKQRAPSKFAEFVKENAAAIKAQLPAGTPQKEVMERVAGMWAAAKQQQQQQQQQQQGAAGSQATAATTISLLDD